MKKKIFRVLLAAFSAILLLAALAVTCSAEKILVAEGYCVKGASGAAVPTNVKWEVFAENGEQTLYFSIDKSKNDANTVLHAKDKSTGADIAFYKAGGSDVLPWGAYITKISKAVIGDGITEISGAAFAYSSIKSLEIPKSLVKLGYAALNRTLELDTVNITGEEANPGVVNLKYITAIDKNVFGGENRIKKYSFNPDYAGAIGDEVFS